MRTRYLATLALGLLVGSSAFAGNGRECASKSNDDPQVLRESLPIKHYEYGMKLDVAEVIWLSDHFGQEGVVKSQMIYRDKQGTLHQIEYMRDLGMRNQNG